ncbi:Uu.00g109450.m01.CDS01 [Anthostomella pinea]|uniref:Uu.00g109450.m01.CDS01 n=1 Tax=Anthostomella pinea TaxID=933095 RepID=A0AAI8VES7_9PEZI|nr:Uu.00g109450.m01.CDS01 [Anthostomella pinea]
MPSQSSYSVSFSSYSSFSSSTNNGQAQRTAYAERSYTDGSGTTTERLSQLPGQAPVHERVEQPSGGRRQVQGAQVSTQNRIQDVTDADEE